MPGGSTDPTSTRHRAHPSDISTPKRERHGAHAPLEAAPKAPDHPAPTPEDARDPTGAPSRSTTQREQETGSNRGAPTTLHPHPLETRPLLTDRLTLLT